MGHLFSKSVTTSACGSSNNNNKNNSIIVSENLRTTSSRTAVNASNNRRSRPVTTASVGPTINLKIQEEISSGNSNALVHNSGSNFSASNNSNCPTQIIIKIQLAKMENGNEQEHQQHEQLLETYADDTLSSDYGLVDANLNINDSNAQILNLMVQRNFSSCETSADNTIEFDQSTSESAEYCEVLDDEPSTSGFMTRTRVDHVAASDTDNNNCCHRKSKLSSSSSTTTKARCCKSTCRDAFRRILEPSTSRLHKSKERREHHKHSSNNNQCAARARVSQQQQPPRSNSNSNSPSNDGSPTHTNVSARMTRRNENSASGSRNMSIWKQSNNDVLIPINSDQQFLLVQCPTRSLVTLGRNDNAICLMATDFVGNSGSSNSCERASPLSSSRTFNGQIVHSQVDFMHHLVPDLERITNSSFYWGKMDRYEAERLLENKPEGTFLLRDSAQEEFLFSVTFRKYGRSLHARIEQSEKKFSFDCHDPSVFTAPTVTGLLEHYKDPACAMFFEPMLTTPLHRTTTFSLQELCRSTIVSHTSYDGINELELPTRLQHYLKEYHYKQRLRITPCIDQSSHT